MLKDPRIKALASKAAVKIKALTGYPPKPDRGDLPGIQTAGRFLQGSNAEELETPSVTPDPKSTN